MELDIGTIERILARKSDVIIRQRYVKGQTITEIYEAKVAWASRHIERENGNEQGS